MLGGQGSPGTILEDSSPSNMTEGDHEQSRSDLGEADGCHIVGPSEGLMAIPTNVDRGCCPTRVTSSGEVAGNTSCDQGPSSPQQLRKGVFGGKRGVPFSGQ